MDSDSEMAPQETLVEDPTNGEEGFGGDVVEQQDFHMEEVMINRLRMILMDSSLFLYVHIFC